VLDLLTAGVILFGSPDADSPPCDPAAGITTDCVQMQLPEETEGRQIDCPDGQVGRQVADMVICPPAVSVPVPTTPAPAPAAVATAEGGAPGAEAAAGPNTPAVPPVIRPSAPAFVFDVAGLWQSLTRLLPWIFGGLA
jgi:hypothetical protein